MGIGKRIKEARENAGLTQKELAAKIGVTGSAITNYEQDTSHPKESILYSLINVLNVDANFLFQDMMNSDLLDFNVEPHEKNLLQKYRQLPETGKQAVESMMDTMLAAQSPQSGESERVMRLEQQPMKVTRGYAAFGGNGWQTYETETTPEKEARIERMMQELDAKKAREAAEEEERRLRIVKLHEEEEKARKKSRRGRK